MAVHSCKRCGYARVASDAIACPSCGSNDPHTSKFMLYFWAMVWLIVSLGVLLAAQGELKLLGVFMLLGALGSFYGAWRK